MKPVYYYGPCLWNDKEDLRAAGRLDVFKRPLKNIPFNLTFTFFFFIYDLNIV